MKCDVAIIGGGPAGSCLGSILKKYDPSLEVAIFERDRFPRDHVGESLLPTVSVLLDEIGAYEKIEEAMFPVKIGATYRWGRTKDLWDFEFVPGKAYIDAPRPAKFEGQRRSLAFQVDRSKFDKILLDHSASLGCRVFEQTQVKKVDRAGDFVEGLILADDTKVNARYYVDCSGDSGIIRRTLEVPTEAPTILRNIAIWDYWQDAEWAVTIGTGGTRIQIMSLGWGWLWFIPITTTRTSIGLVVPADVYKQSGLTTEQIYTKAIAEEPLIQHLTKGAQRELNLNTCKDWSFVAERLCGENWFLAGDTCGFADPILSAGMTLATSGARRVAYAILELDRGTLDSHWIKETFDREHRRQIKHHVKFADYWYSANGNFTDLKELCTNISQSAGLNLDADSAFRWLATGGFSTEYPGFARAFTFALSGVKDLASHFSGKRPEWQATKANKFVLNLGGAVREEYPILENGRMLAVPCFRRNTAILPLMGVYASLFQALSRSSDGLEVIEWARFYLLQHLEIRKINRSHVTWIVEGLEAMITDAWVTASYDPERPGIGWKSPEEIDVFHKNEDNIII